MKLTRRRFLRVLGTLVALPQLEAFSTEQPTRRFLLFFGPNGAVMDAWTPVDTGPGFALSPSLQPLAAVRDQVAVISGLDNVPGPPIHTFRTRSMLAERLPDGPYGKRFGRTLDQLVAPHLAGGGTIPSMQLASEGATACGTTDCSNLYTVSWSDEFTSLPRDIHPRAVFDRLFSDGTADASEAARQLRLRRQRSVLDAVLGDVSQLQGQLGAADRAVLDRYLSGVRELERQLEAPVPAAGSCTVGPVLPPTTEVEALTDQMLDLITLALECDRTRVITYMVASAESYRPLSFLGLPSDHHTVSHFDPGSHEAITTWQVSRFAALVARLRGVVQPDGRTLLEDTTMMYASGLSDATTHDHESLPILLAGGGAPQLGQHVRLPAGTQLAGLALSVAQALGVEAPSFGLDGLTPALDLRS